MRRSHRNTYKTLRTENKLAGTRRHQPPEVVARVRELLKRGETVANIERRIHVSKSFIKRMKADLKLEGRNNSSEETE